jgi:hypothetical protein
MIFVASKIHHLIHEDRQLWQRSGVQMQEPTDVAASAGDLSAKEGVAFP